MILRNIILSKRSHTHIYVPNDAIYKKYKKRQDLGTVIEIRSVVYGYCGCLDKGKRELLREMEIFYVDWVVAT